ncbi:MAG: outer membrane lipoprotein carrier protein LolA [Arachidicoccus sp.]|nr:outer membrane lipoprotein carrier protein LolA [Arachidicoccus sp.]
MKKFISVVMMFFAAGTILAQSDAKSILNKVNNNLQSIKGATANFNYSTKDRNNKNLGNITGKIAIKGSKYFIQQGSTQIYSNGRKIWNFNGSDEVNVSDIDNSGSTLSPQKILSGDFINKDFTSKLISNNGSLAVIELTPTDNRKNFSKVNVTVNKTRNLITKAIIFEKGGNTVTFNLSDINTNVTLADSKFAFDPKAHPGVEVID